MAAFLAAALEAAAVGWAAASAGVASWFSSGLKPEILTTTNSLGVALFAATIALLGTGYPAVIRPQKSPTDYAEFVNIYRVQFFVDAVIRGSLWFGGACVASTFFVVIDRQSETTGTDAALNILASNITTFGLLWALAYFIGRSFKYGSSVPGRR